jgi:hypothetical protein
VFVEAFGGATGHEAALGDALLHGLDHLSKEQLLEGLAHGGLLIGRPFGYRELAPSKTDAAPGLAQEHVPGKLVCRADHLEHLELSVEGSSGVDGLNDLDQVSRLGTERVQGTDDVREARAPL